jgi:predicted ABC-type ATPase
VSEILDRRPLIVALAGPNGAGKTTFYSVFLKSMGLYFVSADVLVQELSLGPYEAAELANTLRQKLAAERESFIFETVFSDPVGDKLGFLKRAAEDGYTVVLCFIGIPDADTSEQRVAMRVSQGGHDVPTEKLAERFERGLRNLEAGIRELPHVWVFDNGDLERPFRRVATFRSGRLAELHQPVPGWLQPRLPEVPKA